MKISQIGIDEACGRLEDGRTVFLDIRDPQSHEIGHIPGSVHLHDGNVEDFLSSADRDRPVVVYCYHGNSSIGGASYLMEQGFREVYSMAGGFEAWKVSYPERVGTRS